MSYDNVMRIARTEDVEFQKELVDAVLKGESVREIRGRIAERKAPVASGREEGKSTKGTTPNGPLMFSFSETYEGCTATVRGPEGKNTKRHMRTALKRLIKQL